DTADPRRELFADRQGEHLLADAPTAEARTDEEVHDRGRVLGILAAQHVHRAGAHSPDLDDAGRGGLDELLAHALGGVADPPLGHLGFPQDREERILVGTLRRPQRDERAYDGSSDRDSGCHALSVARPSPVATDGAPLLLEGRCCRTGCYCPAATARAASAGLPRPCGCTTRSRDRARRS